MPRRLCHKMSAIVSSLTPASLSRIPTVCKPRRRFQFLCSDDACRAANATRVTGVNYDKLVEDERDRVVVKPHFRMNPETQHDPGCEWVARDRLFEALDPPDEMPSRLGEGRRFRRLKSSDLVDVFLPAQTATATAPSTFTRLVPLRARGGEATRVDCGNARNPRGLSNPTRTDFLETVVSAYELLDPEERREGMLRIGRGSRLPYSKAFCRIEHYFSAGGNRIFHGGVHVQPHGPTLRCGSSIASSKWAGREKAILSRSRCT